MRVNRAHLGFRDHAGVVVVAHFKRRSTNASFVVPLVEREMEKKSGFASSLNARTRARKVCADGSEESASAWKGMAKHLKLNRTTTSL